MKGSPPEEKSLPEGQSQLEGSVAACEGALRAVQIGRVQCSALIMIRRALRLADNHASEGGKILDGCEKTVANFAQPIRAKFVEMDTLKENILGEEDLPYLNCLAGSLIYLKAIEQSASVGIKPRVDKLIFDLEHLMQSVNILCGTYRRESAGSVTVRVWVSKITTGLKEEAALQRIGDVTRVATEQGITENLRPFSINQRIRAIIGVAHPVFRAKLTEAAKKQGWLND